MSERLAQPPGGRVMVDSAAVVLLFTIAVLPLRQSYSGSGWFVVAMVGMALGIGIAVLVRARGYGVEVAVPALVFVYLLLAGPIALRSSGVFAGVPDPETVGEVLQGTVSCWLQLLETAPPADSAGPLLLIPFVLGIVGAGTAGILAFSSDRHPGLPVLPLVAVLVVTSLMGTRDEWTVVLSGNVFAGVALGWLILRAPRAEVRPARGWAALGARLLSLALLVALAFAALPFAGSLEGSLPDRVVLRERVHGFDAAALSTPLNDFRRFTEQPPRTPYNLRDTVLLRVDGLAPGARLRFVTLDGYDGKNWYASSRQDDTTTEDRFLRIGSHLDPPSQGKEVMVDVDVKKTWDLPWVPTAGALESIDFYAVVADDRRTQLRYNPATGTVALVPVLEGYEDYVFRARLAPSRLTPRMRASGELSTSLAREAKFLAPVARRMARGARGPVQRLFRAAQQLREHGRYANADLPWQRVPTGHDRERLGPGFLGSARAIGDEEQYASAMALVAVNLGVPARVVVGARVPPHGRVRGADVTAWVEVRVADRSWRVLDTAEFMSHRPPRRGEPAQPLTTPPQAADQQPVQPPEPDQRSEQGQDHQEQNDGSYGRWLVVLLLPALVPLAKLTRRRRRHTAARPSLRLAGAWAEVVDHARDLGMDVPAGVTRPAQARACAVEPTLARWVDRGVFQPGQPDDETIRAAWSVSDDVRRELSGRARRWRRLLAPWNLRSLARRS